MDPYHLRFFFTVSGNLFGSTLIWICNHAGFFIFSLSYSFLPGRKDPVSVHKLAGVHVDVSKEASYLHITTCLLKKKYRSKFIKLKG